jgi:hypothetical protein
MTALKDADRSSRCGRHLRGAAARASQNPCAQSSIARRLQTLASAATTRCRSLSPGRVAPSVDNSPTWTPARKRPKGVRGDHLFLPRARNNAGQHSSPELFRDRPITRRHRDAGTGNLMRCEIRWLISSWADRAAEPNRVWSKHMNMRPVRSSPVIAATRLSALTDIWTSSLKAENCPYGNTNPSCQNYPQRAAPASAIAPPPCPTDYPSPDGDVSAMLDSARQQAAQAESDMTSQVFAANTPQ